MNSCSCCFQMILDKRQDLGINFFTSPDKTSNDRPIPKSRIIFGRARPHQCKLLYSYRLNRRHAGTTHCKFLILQIFQCSLSRASFESSLKSRSWWRTLLLIGGLPPFIEYATNL